MEENIKNIVALYIKVPAGAINNDTIIDRSAVESSIMLHRMYAHLSRENFVVADYWNIKTYGTFLQKLNGKIVLPVTLLYEPVVIYNNALNNGSTAASIGIDIEEISQLLQPADYREDEFYTMNFAPEEIAYCILQPSPAASFTGLFAVKEAIVKADNSYADKLFNTIIINHLPGGKPVHALFEISISHTSLLAVGIAIRQPQITSDKNNAAVMLAAVSDTRKTFLTLFFAVAAFLFSAIALLICYLRN